jgi:enoyl-CoA hydratase/carnithine racemase
MHLRSEALDTPVWRAWLVPGAAENPALTPTLLAELEALLRRADADERCRAVVIASEAGEFCRGIDLDGLARGVYPGGYAGAVAGYARCLALLRGVRPATIAVVEGTATGGGVGVAAACDMVIADRSATFTLPELLFGLIPAVVLPILTERVGPARARWLALTGDTIHAAIAERLGLVDECCDDAAVALAARLRRLMRSSPAAVGRLKRFAAEIAGLPREAALSAGAARTTADLEDPEIQAAIRGFIAGELPKWSVRYKPGGPA